MEQPVGFTDWLDAFFTETSRPQLIGSFCERLEMRLSRQREEPPGGVVRRAYLAANRGRFAEANRWLTKEVRRDILTSAVRFRRNVESIRRCLRQVSDPRTRSMLIELLVQSQRLADPYFCWKAATRNKGIATLTVTRAVVRGGRAKVYLRLRLHSGKVVREAEDVVWRKGRWLIG